MSGDRFRPPQPAGEYKVNMNDLSSQVAAVSKQVTDVAYAVSMHGKRINGLQIQLDNVANALEQRLDGIGQDVSLIRATVMGDHAPRITAVETKTSTLGSKAIGAGKCALMISGGVGVALQVASAFYPKAVGPLQALLQVLQAAQ